MSKKGNVDKKKKDKRIETYYPFNNEWEKKEIIGKGNQAKVYKILNKKANEIVGAMREETIEFPNNVSAKQKDITGKLQSIIDKRKRLLDEIRNFDNQRNIVKVFEIDSHIQGRTGYIYERIEFLESLSEKIKGEISENEIINLGIDICSALEVFHQSGIVHRDVKPSNILFGDGAYKLGDYYISKREDELKTKCFDREGSYSTMAPEVFKGEKCDRRVDVYGMGMTLYLLLNNMNLPFHEDPKQSAKIRAEGKKLEFVKGVSPELMKIVFKACEPEVSQRYLSISEMKYALINVKLFCSENKYFKQSNMSNDSTVLFQTFCNNKATQEDTTFVFFDWNSEANPEMENKNIFKPAVQNEEEDAFVKHKNVISWILCTCIVGLVPITIYFVCNIILDKKSISPYVFTHEILFFSFVLLTNMMKTLIIGKTRKRNINMVILFAISGVILSFVVLIAFIIFVFNECLDNTLIDTKVISNFSIVIFIASSIISFLTERMEDKK